MIQAASSYSSLAVYGSSASTGVYGSPAAERVHASAGVTSTRAGYQRGAALERPILQAESPQKEGADQRRFDSVPESGELAEPPDTSTFPRDDLIERFIERIDGNNRQRENESGVLEGQRIEQAAAEVDNKPSIGGQSFSDLRSALDYWEGLRPEREDTSKLSAPIATYRSIESGPAPSFGLSAYA